MTLSTHGLLDPLATNALVAPGRSVPLNGKHTTWRPPPQDGDGYAEFLRRCAWEIGEGHPADAYTPPVNHVGLGMVAPVQGFVHWRIQQEWVDQTAGRKGNAWHNSRLIIRLYDVSYIHFNGMNANEMHDYPLPGLCGQLFFKLPRPGTWQLAEVGFLLQNGEFIAAARSQTVPFAPDSGCARGSAEALLVDPQGRVEPVGNLWDQDRILRERRRPHLREPLRIANFAFASLASGQQGTLARFVSELATGLVTRGHEAHLFLPASSSFHDDCQIDGVHYHPLPVHCSESPVATAQAFAQAAAERLRDLPPFDLMHLHEWMSGYVQRPGELPSILSLGSVEATRRNGTPPSPLSLAVQQAERETAQAASYVLTPDWLRDRAIDELALDGARVRAFPMEGRMPNEWECHLDYGQVKKEIGVGPLDRLLLFVGPLEHAAGVDLLIEALPVLLRRWSNLRIAYIGAGNQSGALQHRAHELGVAYAVRFLGHVEGPMVTRLVRSAEALVLPSRYRMPLDDAVVDLARRAGRPVVTTHGGPAHLIRHEETGVVTYDNPGSMVWAADRILGDPVHAQQMGQNGRRADQGMVVWSEVARYYLELCGACFPELTEARW